MKLERYKKNLIGRLVPHELGELCFYDDVKYVEWHINNLNKKIKKNEDEFIEYQTRATSLINDYKQDAADNHTLVRKLTISSLLAVLFGTLSFVYYLLSVPH